MTAVTFLDEGFLFPGSSASLSRTLGEGSTFLILGDSLFDDLFFACMSKSSGRTFVEAAKEGGTSSTFSNLVSGDSLRWFLSWDLALLTTGPLPNDAFDLTSNICDDRGMV